MDGCNIIFAWEDLRDLAQADFHAAQSRLMDILSDYQGIKGCILILVFDAYRVEGHPEETFQYHNIHVVYTKEAETADQYIERTVHKIGRKHNVTVATSDGLEQIIIMGQGAARISARGFKDEIASAKQYDTGTEISYGRHPSGKKEKRRIITKNICPHCRHISQK